MPLIGTWSASCPYTTALTRRSTSSRSHVTKSPYVHIQHDRPGNVRCVFAFPGVARQNITGWYLKTCHDVKFCQKKRPQSGFRSLLPRPHPSSARHTLILCSCLTPVAFGTSLKLDARSSSMLAQARCSLKLDARSSSMLAQARCSLKLDARSSSMLAQARCSLKLDAHSLHGPSGLHSALRLDATSAHSSLKMFWADGEPSKKS
jgi:hypothetical protein